MATTIISRSYLSSSSAAHSRNLSAETLYLYLSTPVKFSIHNRDLRAKTLILSTSVKSASRTNLRDVPSQRNAFGMMGLSSARSRRNYSSSNRCLSSSASVAKRSDPVRTGDDLIGKLQKLFSEKSFWGALMNTVLHTVIFMALGKTVVFLLCKTNLVEPTATVDYVVKASRAASIASLVWHLHQWKTNAMAQLIEENVFYSNKLLASDQFLIRYVNCIANEASRGASISWIRRHLNELRTNTVSQSIEENVLYSRKLLAIDKYLSVGLFGFGLGVLALLCGKEGQYMALGVGGVGTTFAFKEIAKNIVEGLHLWIPQQFNVGEITKVESKEVHTMIDLLTAERNVSRKVIVRKSRPPSRQIVKKMKWPIECTDKLSLIIQDIQSMLRAKSYQDPRCYVTDIQKSHLEVTIRCTTHTFDKKAEEDILPEILYIIEGHGVQLV